jgi:hypothetical protein
VSHANAPQDEGNIRKQRPSGHSSLHPGNFFISLDFVDGFKGILAIFHPVFQAQVAEFHALWEAGSNENWEKVCELVESQLRPICHKKLGEGNYRKLGRHVVKTFEGTKRCVCLFVYLVYLSHLFDSICLSTYLSIYVCINLSLYINYVNYVYYHVSIYLFTIHPSIHPSIYYII